MPTLSIKEVPEAVAQALRERARRHHRSLQGELMALVTEAAQQEAGVAPANGGAGPRAVSPPEGVRSIEQIAREHAARRPRPERGGPAAGIRVRQDRDAR